MSQTTPTIGLKKPEGSDPFLTEDFASNYDKIDAAFAARPTGGSSGGDAATLGGSPKSYFYGPHNPPPATGVGSHAHNDLYSPIGHTHVGGGGDGLTQEEADALYAPISHGDHSGGGGSYTLPADVMKAPNRTNPRAIFSVTQVQFNGVNGVNGITLDYSAMGYPTPPTVILTCEVGSNFDLVANIQGRVASNCSVRMARVTGQTATHSSQLHWFVIGV